METIVQPNAETTPEIRESNDWLSVHGDYLFNLAVGQFGMRHLPRTSSRRPFWRP